jgi:hypothetical protein
VLKPEDARERLKAWKINPSDDEVSSSGGTRFKKAIAKLPAKLAKVAFGLYGLDETGKTPGVEFKDGGAAFAEAMYGILNQNMTTAADFDRLSSGERTTILQVMFPHMAANVERTWVALRGSPYQYGWQIKAYRAPRNPELSLSARQRWLAELLQIPEAYREESLEPAWLAAWAPYLRQSWPSWEPIIGPLLAKTIDAGGKDASEVFDVLTRSLNNEHEIGSMGRHVVLGLLMSSRQDGWELVEKMLLAAQRQEGLRQSILEAIDLAHPAAYRRMLRIVREHDLARFSAVARAVNVWFGFAWDSISVKVINGIIEAASTMLDDAEIRKKALGGKDPHAAYMALWALAFDDAPASIPAAARLLTNRAAEMRFIAVTHLAHLGLKAAQDTGRIASEDGDMRIALRAAALLQGPAEDGVIDYSTLVSPDDSFERVEKLLQRLPEKPVLLKPIVWPWTGYQVSHESLSPALVKLLGGRPPARLLPYLNAMDPARRRAVAELFGNQKKLDEKTRRSLIDLAADASADVRAAAFTGLKKLKLTDGEVDGLLGTLTRKAADLRMGVIDLVMQQTDARVLACADALVKSKDGNQRLAGLELLRQMCEQKRAAEECRRRAAAFRDWRAKPSRDEERQLDAISMQQPDAAVLTLENALGLMDPAQRTPVESPRNLNAKLFTPAAIACLRQLDDLVHEHREVPVITNPRSQETQLLGAIQWGFPSPHWRKTPESQAKLLPLREVWEEWFEKRSKQTRDADGLELLRANRWCEYALDWQYARWQNWVRRKPHRKAMLAPLDTQKPIELRYPKIVTDLTQWLLFLHRPRTQNSFLLDAVETLAAAVPSQELKALLRTPKSDGESSNEEDCPWYGTDWRDSGYFRDWLGPLYSAGNVFTSDEQQKRWRIGRWLDEPIAGAPRNRPYSTVLMDAYSAGFANLHDIADDLLGPRSPQSVRPQRVYAAREPDKTSSRARRAAFLESTPGSARTRRARPIGDSRNRTATRGSPHGCDSPGPRARLAPRHRHPRSAAPDSGQRGLQTGSELAGRSKVAASANTHTARPRHLPDNRGNARRFRPADALGSSGRFVSGGTTH